MVDEPRFLRQRAEEKVRARLGLLSQRLDSLPAEEARRKLHELQVYEVELEMQNEELRRIGAELEASRERYFELYDLAPIGYVTLSPEGLILEANLTSARILGVDRGRLLRQPLTRFILPEDQDRYYLHRKRLLETKLPQSCELRMLRAGADPFDALLEAAPGQSGDGLHLSRVMFSDDTDRKLGQTARINEQRLESLGVLAGGIAHDFNNLLTIIQGYLSLLGLRAPAGSENLELIDAAQAACGDAKGLAHQLLSFARGGSPVVQVLDLRPLTLQAAGFAVRGSRARCVFELGESPLWVNADPNQVTQVIRNLVLNAVQALPDGGDIAFRAAVVELREGERPPLAAGSYVRMTVRNPGGGIAPELLSKVFDPYFSTKGAGRGLGLAVCRTVMVRHGGSITVESGAALGTVFTLHLPVAPAGAPVHAAAPPGLTSGSGRVLVMDDEPAVAKVLKRMLVSLGYQADSVADGQAALDAWKRAREAGTPYTAAIFDLTIPSGMGGKEAMAGLAALDPEAKGIVSSGYAEDPVMAGYAAYGFSGLLSKPYRIEEVSEVLRRVIAPSRP